MESGFSCLPLCSSVEMDSRFFLKRKGRGDFLWFCAKEFNSQKKGELRKMLVFALLFIAMKVKVNDG